MTRGKIHIGTSGWSYNHWKGPFYPHDLPGSRMLEHYILHFKSVELNNCFYQLPQKRTLAEWYKMVPTEFLFSAKASRYITHMKKLNDPETSTEKFFERIKTLGDKLGPILFQLPPNWHFNAERLEQFLAALSRKYRYTFEFRDQSWINDQTLALLTRFDCAFCVYELDGYLSPREITTDFVYIRLHGPDGPYQGSYDDQALNDWADAISSWAGKGLSVYCYFDNDEAGYAARNALQLQSLLETSN
jgi:uncharacterized protein YecE (DUF72 family)